MYTYDSLSHYEIAHVVDHLIGVGNVNAVTKLLTDEEFLERKLQLGMDADLSAEMNLALNLPEINGSTESVLQFACRAFLSSESFIRRHPETLLQSMWNNLHWRGDADAGRFFEKRTLTGDGCLTSVQKHIGEWMARWRRKKEATENFRWVRHIRPVPGGRASTMRREFDGHLQAVFSAKFSLDGTKIAAGSVTPIGGEKVDDGAGAKVIVWDSVSGVVIFEALQESSVQSIAFSPDGIYVAATIGGQTIRVLEAASGRVERDIILPDGSGARSVVFSADGRFILCGCLSNVARLIDARSGTVVLELTDHEDRVVDVHFVGNTGRILTGCADGLIRVWDPDSGHCIQSIQGVGGAVSAVTVSKDGKYVASSFGEKRSLPPPKSDEVKTNFDIQVFNLETGELIGCLKGHEEVAGSIAFSPDGKTLVSSGGYLMMGDRTIHVWDAPNFTRRYQLDGHEMETTWLEFSPDGNRLLSSALDGTVRMWDMHSPVAMPRLKQHEGNVFGSTFSPDGRYIATSSFDESRILVWRSTDGSVLHELEGHESLVRCFQFSNDSSMLISGSGSKYNGIDCSARIWDVETGRELMLLEADQAQGAEWHGHVNPVKVVGFSADEKHAITGHADQLSFLQQVNFIRVWDLSSGQLVDCFSGDDEQAYSLIATANDRQRARAIQRFIAGKKETGIASFSPRSVAGWSGEGLSGLETHAAETAIVLEDGSKYWFPEAVGDVLCANPLGPMWTIASARDVMLVCLEGLDAWQEKITEMPQMTARNKINVSEFINIDDKYFSYNEELFTIIVHGDQSTALRLARDNPEIVRSKDAKGKSLLHRIAQTPLEDRSELVRVLIELGADPNVQDSDGATPLHWVSARPWGRWLAELLLQYGADPLIKSSSGDRPLDTAMRMSGMLGTSMADLLLEHVKKMPNPQVQVQRKDSKKLNWLDRFLRK